MVHSTGEDGGENGSGMDSRKPKLPKQQLSILVICRLAEPLALTSVNPYLPEMIASFGVPQPEIGKWAGVVSSMFSVMQCVTGIPWGAFSDRFGRRPAILFSLTMTMLATIVWGFSSSLPMAAIVRAIGGASNGNVGTMRTIVAEMVPWKELQPLAFSIMPAVWVTGSIFGPVLGGELVYPVERFPSIFGRSALLEKFPFLLPNLIAASFFAIGIITGYLYLEETLEHRRGHVSFGQQIGKSINRAVGRVFMRSEASDAHETGPLLARNAPHNAHANGHATMIKKKAPPSVKWREIFTKQTNLCILVYCLLACHTIAFDNLIPVFMHTEYQPPDAPRNKLPFEFGGGLGLDSKSIGLWATLNAITGVFSQFFIFPPMGRNLGTLQCLKLVAVAFPVTYALTPFAVLLPQGMPQQLALFVSMMLRTLWGCCAYPCSTILLTNSATSLSILGSLNGVATTFSALGRAIGPALCGYVFTIGVRANVVGAAWWVMALIAAIAAVPVFWLVEGEGHVMPASYEDESPEEDPEVGNTISVR